MPRAPDRQLQSRRARRGGLEAGMRFPAPPRGKGGPSPAAPLSLPLLPGAGQTELPASVSQWGRGWRQPWQRVRSRRRATESVPALAGCSLGRADWVWGEEFIQLRARAAQPGLQLDRDGFLPAVVAPAAAALVQSLFLCIREPQAPHQKKDMANLSQLCSDQGSSPSAAAAGQ